METTDGEGQTHNFSTRHAYNIHTDTVSWLSNKLYDEQIDGKTIVVSHHEPSLVCEHNIFGHTDFASAFYSDLPYLMEKTDLWI